MKRITLSLIALLVCCISMIAQQRSESEAIQIAQEFFGKQGKSPQLSVVPTQKVNAQVRKKVASARRAPAKNASFYVVNDEANNRFVIVSADERMCQILGYSDKGVFNPNFVPDALLELMADWDGQNSYLRNLDSSIVFRRKVNNTDAIEPLIKTHWEQSSPYNDMCPENVGLADGSRCASGCVATAMAQVLNYYKYPKTGTGYYSYYTESQYIHQECNFSSLDFNWDNIITTYDDNSTEEQKQEIAKLMHACGVSVAMDYGTKDGNGRVTSSSGAYAFDIPYALINHFNYNPNIVYKNKAYYSDEEWDDLILEELQSKRPVLYSGTDLASRSGHQFILDGYDGNGLFHVNWGWGALMLLGEEITYEGYYALNALKPRLTYFGNTVEEDQVYSSNQAMVCGISPEYCGSREDVFYSDYFELNQYQVALGGQIKVTLRPLCYSSSSTYSRASSTKFNGEVGVGVFDKEFNLIKVLYSEDISCSTTPISLFPAANISKYVSIPSSIFSPGSVYYIAPYAKGRNSTTPTLIRTKSSLYDYYLAEEKGGSVSFTRKGIPPTIPVTAGDYNVSANADERWNINIWQDSEDATKYWISNLDPAVAKKGYNYESGWNKVYGYINEDHTQLSVPVNQEIGKDIVIRNISGGDNITIQLTEKDSKMYFSGINDIWGSKEFSEESEMSKYQYTTIAYGKIDIEDPTPEPTSDPVEKPSIDVSSNTFTLHCGTEGAAIYYTTDNTSPTENSSRYNYMSVPLYHNCTIKAIAFKGGQSSEVAIYKVTTFKVAIPDIHQDVNHITFTCATDGATIYYDWDGKTRQTGSLDIIKSGVIKVYAEKDDFIKSDVKEQSLEYTPASNPEPSPDILVIADNEAGKLSSRISDTDKLSATRLTVSGKINGTDIIFIREMFYHGKLTDLDIENATIVSGGDAYDTTINAVTKDNVVGKYFFENCKQMISIKLPSNAVKIEGGAFSGCKSLKKLDIPASCVEVESMIVSSCDNLEEVNLSDAVQKFPGLAVYSSKNLMRINVSEGNQYFKSVDGVLFSKDGKTIVRYPMGKDDESYTIPEGVIIVGKEAFDYAKITSITIPNTVTTIESSAFENCKNIQILEIPNSVITIGSSAFSGCDKLDNVTMSSEVSSIESFAFGSCKNLRKFYIGAKVSSINKLAFYNCQSLQEFEVDENSSFFTTQSGILYTKDMQELVKCPMALYAEEYIVPNGVKVIRAEAFATCTNIKRFYLPETLTTIGECAFENCEMASIRIPQTVTSIGESAFNRCDNLESLVLPEGTNKIQNTTLHGCKSLTYVYIPANVKEFGMWAIADCPLLTMINSQITDIDKVTVHYDSYEAYYDAFEKIPTDCTWRVPAGGAKGTADYDKYAELYKAQPWWVSTWKIIIEDNTVGIDDIAVSDYRISWNDGKLNIKSDRNGVIRIYAINGTLVQDISVKGGETYQVELPRGMYIINNKKIMLK